MVHYGQNTIEYEQRGWGLGGICFKFIGRKISRNCMLGTILLCNVDHAGQWHLCNRSTNLNQPHFLAIGQLVHPTHKHSCGDTCTHQSTQPPTKVHVHTYKHAHTSLPLDLTLNTLTRDV